jgi:YVTN family beta-propeller protein
MKQLIISLALLLSLSIACKKDEVKSDDLPQGQEVLYISNEGTFGSGNGSLSLYFPATDSVVNKVFKQVNNRPVGDVLQSVFHHGTTLYMMVNASSKVEIADATTLQEKGVIQNIESPRYMQAVDNKGYISDWGSQGQVAVVDLSTNQVAKTIAVGSGPEKMLISNNHLLVCNSGGFDTDSTLSIIDLSSEQVINTLQLGDAPSDIIQTDDQTIWVLCRGKIIYDDAWQVIGHTPSKLVKLSASNFSIETVIELFSNAHPAQMVFSQTSNRLYIGGGYGFNGIYYFDLAQQAINISPISPLSFYGIGTDTQGRIYGFEAPDFVSNGWMHQFDATGIFVKKLQVGIGPNGMCQ